MHKIIGADQKEFGPPPVIVSRPPRHAWPVWTAVVVLAGAMVLFAFDPAHNRLYPRCLFHAATGLHCPGCGALRGAHRLLHGHPVEALRMNLLLFGLLPVAGAVGLWLHWRRRTSRNAGGIAATNAWPWLLLAATLLFWVLRNLPFHPFTLLAPST